MGHKGLDKYGRGSAALNGAGFVNLAPDDTFDIVKDACSERTPRGETAPFQNIASFARNSISDKAISKPPHWCGKMPHLRRGGILPPQIQRGFEITSYYSACPTAWSEWRIPMEQLRTVCFQTVNAGTPPFNHREAAIAWAREYGVVGTMSNEESGGKGCILISVGSLREMLNPVQIGKSSSLSVHFAAVAVLRDLIRVSVIVERYFDRKKGRDGIRHLENGVNANVLIEVGYAAMAFERKLHRVKLTLKRFADSHTPAKAYAYHVTQIEVLAGTIGNDLSDTTPNANTPTTNQAQANLNLMSDIVLNGVRDVNGTLLLPDQTAEPSA